MARAAEFSWERCARETLRIFAETSASYGHNTQDCPFPNPRLPVSGVPLEGFRRIQVCAGVGHGRSWGCSAYSSVSHWSIAIVGAVVVLALSAVESELFLLFIIFLIPFSWSIDPQGSRHDVAKRNSLLW